MNRFTVETVFTGLLTDQFFTRVVLSFWQWYYEQMELSLLIPVCIHKSYIVYLVIHVVPIGHGFSFLVMEKSWKSHGKSMLKKRGHPDPRIKANVTLW